jgi:hypothetical protein
MGTFGKNDKTLTKLQGVLVDKENHVIYRINNGDYPRNSIPLEAHDICSAGVQKK